MAVTRCHRLYIARCEGAIPVGTSEDYRRFAEECVQLARSVASPQSQAMLLHMAEVWFRLAQEHVRDAAEKIES